MGRGKSRGHHLCGHALCNHGTAPRVPMATARQDHPTARMGMSGPVEEKGKGLCSGMDQREFSRKKRGRDTSAAMHTLGDRTVGTEAQEVAKRL